MLKGAWLIHPCSHTAEVVSTGTSDLNLGLLDFQLLLSLLLTATISQTTLGIHVRVLLLFLSSSYSNSLTPVLAILTIKHVKQPVSVLTYNLCGFSGICRRSLVLVTHCEKAGTIVVSLLIPDCRLISRILYIFFTELKTTRQFFLPW